MMPRYLAEQHWNTHLSFLSLKMGTVEKGYMGKRKSQYFIIPLKFYLYQYNSGRRF